ncbi:hypothetical protein [Enterococcus sp.]|uniref:hypothetical protein n=1 Tax=Enterococcus sp. TaxID=35783 RepID=UPI002911ED9B|nr:hypothetical protein [Enterococcus sp.]MDU5336495.1 hypothetical protein [Enterococcus sp.]
MNNFEYLDDKQWSPLWERYLANATLFDPHRKHDINCLIPLPEKRGLLIFTDNHVYYSNINALATLHRFSSIHSFPDYEVLSISLKESGCFGKYKFPWVCPYFTLCPLEGKDQTIWINPYKISMIFESHGQHYAQLTNGLYMILPVHRRSVIDRAELACLILATMRRGHFHYVITGLTPLDYLFFPDTKFADTLRTRLGLKKFQTAIGELNHLYQKAYSLYHFERLIDDPQEIDGIDWL